MRHIVYLRAYGSKGQSGDIRRYILSSTNKLYLIQSKVLQVETGQEGSSGDQLMYGYGDADGDKLTKIAFSSSVQLKLGQYPFRWERRASGC